MIARNPLPMLVTALFVAGSALLTPVTVQAQSPDMAQMDQGLNMLMQNLELALRQDGMAGLDVESLTLSQVIEISNALRSSDPQVRKSKIEAALKRK